MARNPSPNDEDARQARLRAAIARLADRLADLLEEEDGPVTERPAGRGVS